MSVVSIHGRDAGAFAKSVLHHLLQNGDVAGWDAAGRAILQLSIDDWLLEELCAFDSDAAELEDTDGEPEPDQEIDGPPVIPDIVPTKRSDIVSHCWPALVRSPDVRFGTSEAREQCQER